MKERGKVASAVGLVFVFVISMLAFAAAQSEDEKSTSSFDLNSLILKASIVQGDSVTKMLTISKAQGQQLNLEVVNLAGVSLSESSFILEAGESKNVAVNFDSLGLIDGVYTGTIKIYDDLNTLYLPVIFEIESRDIFYDVNLDIAPQYTTIAPGEKLVAQLRIFDLTSGGTSEGLGRNSITLEYRVKSFDGKIISAETESIVVDKQATLTKAITFPQSIEEGNYAFYVAAKYKSSTGVASYLFQIENEKEGVGLSVKLFEGIDVGLIIIIVVIILFFISLIFLFVYLIRGRDSVIMEMKRYNEEESERQRQFILEQEKILRRKGVAEDKILAQKRKNLDRIQRQKSERIDKLNELSKKGNEQDMQNQLIQWKKQGYNTMGLEYKMKGLSQKDMKNLLKVWKKQYGKENKGYKKR